MSSSQFAFFMQRSALHARSSIARLCAIAGFALLAGCEGEVTMDLSTEQPADPDIVAVIADIRGLEFVTSGGGTETLEFTDSQQLDLMDYADDSNVLRLFTSEELSEGNYTGVRLLFDEDLLDEAFVSRLDGTDFPMNLVAGDYAPLSFSVEDRESNSESFTLMLDLRQSLSFDEDDDEYTFTPIMRAVDSGDASRIEGDISATCPAGGSLSQGAVYLFQGEDVTPDDLDGVGIEPFATAPVLTDQGGAFFYALRVVPEGNYTLALTCIGNDEDILSDQDLEFRNIVNVRLDRSEALIVDIP
jgi:hypothetical protein